MASNDGLSSSGGYLFNVSNKSLSGSSGLVSGNGSIGSLSNGGNRDFVQKDTDYSSTPLFDLSDGNPDILFENLPVELEHCTIDTRRCGYSEPQGTLDALILDTHRCYHPHLPLATHDIVTTGHGSTQLIYNAVLALREILGRRVTIWYQKPYYTYMYRLLENDANCILVTNECMKNNVDVEIVTSPNNPTGEERTFETVAKYHIIDCAYLWPQYSDATTESIPIYQENMYVFSFSKLSGMGGLRVGWSLSYPGPWTDALRNRIYLTHMSCIVPSLLIAEGFLNYMLKHPSDIRGLWYSTRKKMDELRGSIGSILPVCNNYGPYCWVDISKGELEKQYGIIGKNGAEFGEPNFTRLSLMGTDQLRRSLLTHIHRIIDITYSQQ